MTEILIDTNVLVYAHDLAEPQKRVQARHIIRELQQGRLGCLSIQCISEFFHAVTRGSAPKLNVLEASNQANVLLNSFPYFRLRT
jgi:predicted nucleic acid-binding protein